MNNRFIVFVLFVLSSLSVFAQQTQKEFQDRYDLLVSKLGYNGVGVETLLNKWEALYPEDVNMLVGKYLYYFTKATTTSVEKMVDVSKYLGLSPTLSLKDSLGRTVNFFQVNKYDDVLFGKAIENIDKAIAVDPTSLELRQAKISSYIAFEGASPDIAKKDIISLIDYNFAFHPKWTYPGLQSVTTQDFNSVIQQLTYMFYNIGTDVCYNYFLEISGRMLKYEPKEVNFIDNIGTYYLVAKKDYKKALKYYKKALKIKNDDIAAIKNIVIIARTTKNKQLEKQYLPLLITHTSSATEKQSMQVRLDYLNK